MQSRAAHTHKKATTAGETTSLLHSIDPLDNDEQQQIIEDLQREADALSHSNRMTMRGLYLFISTILFVVWTYSYMYPWEMSHQKVFHDLVSHAFFQIYYVVMCGIFLVGSYAIYEGLSAIPKYVKIAVALLSTSLSIVWAAVFWKHGVSEPALYWLPLVPVSSVALAVYLDKDNDSLLNEVAKLNSLKYDFKKA